MKNLQFDNRFTQELPQDPITDNYQRQVSNALWSIAQPTPVKNPQLLAYSPDVAAMLGLTNDDMQDPELIHTLGGNGALAGMITYATRYGGHQFGHWAGQHPTHEVLMGVLCYAQACANFYALKPCIILAFLPHAH
jgi:protein adenylyltransferase